MTDVELYKQIVTRKHNGDHRGGDHMAIGFLWRNLSPSEREEVLHFAECLREGTSPTLAEMFSSGKGPCVQTDATFLRGHCNGNQFAGKSEADGDRLREIAEAGGQSTKGKVYLPSLAAHPGDPLAWVDGKGDVKRVAEARGWNCEGAVDVKSFEPPKANKRKAGKLKDRLKAAGLPMSE